MYSEEPQPEQIKDRTKLLWAGVGLVFILMIASLWFMGRPDPNVSTVTIKHILISYDKADITDRNRALETISELRKRILAGEDFAKIAKEYSDETGSGRRGGHLGGFRRGMLETNIEKYAWTAPIGELSDILSSSYGFHLVVVTDRYITESDRYETRMNEKAKELMEQELEKKTAP